MFLHVCDKFKTHQELAADIIPPTSVYRDRARLVSEMVFWTRREWTSSWSRPKRNMHKVCPRFFAIGNVVTASCRRRRCWHPGRHPNMEPLPYFQTEHHSSCLNLLRARLLLNNPAWAYPRRRGAPDCPPDFAKLEAARKEIIIATSTSSLQITVAHQRFGLRIGQAGLRPPERSFPISPVRSTVATTRE